MTSCDDVNEEPRQESGTPVAHGTESAAAIALAVEEEVQFEEPMVFDLVRGLGSKPGEMEANYLMIVPLNDEPVLMSPEFEFVFSPYQAAEIEFPFQDDKQVHHCSVC